MSDIVWKTYIEPMTHRDVAEVTEDNVLDFCKKFGWTLSYEEKKVAPFPNGRAMVAKVGGIAGRRGDKVELPFWVQLRGEVAYEMNAPRSDWEEVLVDE